MANEGIAAQKAAREARRRLKGPLGLDGEDFDEIARAAWTLLRYFGAKYWGRRYDPLKQQRGEYENR